MDKNFIIETIRSEQFNEVNIFFYKDKTIEIKNFRGDKNIKYIDMDTINKIIEKTKELGWL